MSQNFASWEKHTTGFGSKMLAKMGFVPGKGLGAKGSGISKPVQVSSRKIHVGLGFDPSDGVQNEEGKKRRGEKSDGEENSSDSSFEGSSQEEEEEENQEFIPLSLKKSHREKKSRAKKKQEKYGNFSGMTTKNSRGFIEPLKEEKATNFCKELNYNIKLLANLSEKQVENLEKKI
eukprot:Sdes_comp19350_c0_seq2m10582